MFTSPVNIRSRGVRTRGHKGDGVGDVALKFCLCRRTMRVNLAISGIREYILPFDNLIAEAVRKKTARGNQFLGRKIRLRMKEHFHCSSPTANLAGVMEDELF